MGGKIIWVLSVPFNFVVNKWGSGVIFIFYSVICSTKSMSFTYFKQAPDPLPPISNWFKIETDIYEMTSPLMAQSHSTAIGLR